MNEDEVRRIVLETLRSLLVGAMTTKHVMNEDGNGSAEIKYVDEDFAEHVQHELDVIEEKRHR